MKIKKGDKVKVLAGKDKGKTGKISQVFPEQERASVDGINMLVKHLRPRQRGEKGQRVEYPAPMNISNLGFVCPQCGKTTRLGHKYTEDEKTKRQKKVRFCKKCQKEVEK